MKVDKIGNYILLEDKRYSSPNMSFGLSKGTIIEVSQIDKSNNKFYASKLRDWQYHEQPFEFIYEN